MKNSPVLTVIKLFGYGAAAIQSYNELSNELYNTVDNSQLIYWSVIKIAFFMTHNISTPINTSQKLNGSYTN